MKIGDVQSSQCAGCGARLYRVFQDNGFWSAWRDCAKSGREAEDCTAVIGATGRSPRKVHHEAMASKVRNEGGMSDGDTD